MFLGKRWTNREESGKRKTAVAQSKLEDEKPKDGKPEEEKPRKDSSLVFLAQMLLCAIEKVERPEVLIASVVGAARDRHGAREPCSLVQTESLAPRAPYAANHAARLLGDCVKDRLEKGLRA